MSVTVYQKEDVTLTSATMDMKSFSSSGEKIMEQSFKHYLKIEILLYEKLYSAQPGLSNKLSFDSPVALIFTPVTNLLFYG